MPDFNPFDMDFDGDVAAVQHIQHRPTVVPPGHELHQLGVSVAGAKKMAQKPGGDGRGRNTGQGRV